MGRDTQQQTMRFLLLCIALIALVNAIRSVDDFSVAQTGVKSSFVGSTVSGAVQGSADVILGTERDLVATLLVDNTAITEDGVELFVSSFLQAMKYSVDTANRGIGEIQWDGLDNGAAVFDTTGLGGVDLTADGDNAFGWYWRSSDIPANVTLEVTDMNGGSSVLPYYNPGSFVANFQTTNLRLTFPYYAFNGDADFTNVGGVRIRFESPGEVDLEVGPFFTERIVNETKTQDISTGVEGDIITYTIVVANPDDDYDAPANEVLIVDALADGLELITGSVTTSRDGQADPTIIVTSGNAPGNEDVEVVALSIADGESITVTFQARFTGDLDCPPNPVPNYATVTIGGSPKDTNTVTAIVTGVTTLNITSTLEESTNTYTVTTCNEGNQVATDVTITASVPDMVMGEDNDDFSCNNAACTAVIGDIRGGMCESVSLTYTVMGTPCGNTPVTPDFSVTQTCVQLTEVTTSGPSFDITGNSDLTATMTATPSANPGGLIMVEVCATNTGNADSDGADVTLSYDSAVVAPESSSVARCVGGVCTFRLEDILASGVAVCETVSFTVASPLECEDIVADFDAVVTDLCTGDEDELSVSTTLNGGGIPTITKTFVGSGAVIPGGLIPFDIEVCNVGNRVSTNVVLTDSYEDYMTPQATNCDAGVCTFQLGDIAPGAVNCVTTRVTYRLVGEVECVMNVDELPATVVEDCLDESATDSASFTINASVFLTIEKAEIGGNEVRPGESLSYTITVANTGNRVAEGVVITEDASDYTTPVANQDGWNCGAVCTYNVGSLAPSDGPQVFYFNVTVNSPIDSNVDEITNVASVSSSPNCPANATTSEETVILANPDLIITKTLISNQPVPAGQNVIFEFNYWNMGDVAAEGVVIEDTIPAYLSVDTDLPANQGWECTGSSCTYDVGTLAPSTTPSTIRLTLTVDAPLPCNVNQAMNNVDISDDGTQGEDTDLTNNQDSESVSFSGNTIISLEVTTSTPSVNAGEQACFTAVISASGTRAATNVQFSFDLPQYTSIASPGYVCNSAGLCESSSVIPSLSSEDDDVTYYFCVNVDSSLPSSVSSTTLNAYVVEECQSREDDATVTIELIARPDLKVCKSGRITTIAYDVDVVNNGSREALNVRMEERVPAGTEFNAAASDPRWVCDEEEQGLCVIEIERIAPGEYETAYIVFDMIAEIDTCTIVQNIATATLENGPELDDTNNMDAITFSVCEGSSCPNQNAGRECVCNVPEVTVPECVCNCTTPDVIECSNTVCEESTCTQCEEAEDETVINLQFDAVPSTCQ